MIFSSDTAHSNRMWFDGILCSIDSASDRNPGGSRSHRVLIPASTAKHYAETLVGMGVNYSLSGHSAQQKVGVITSVEVCEEASQIHVKGFLYAWDFPEVVKQIYASADLGMSYEMCDCHVFDMRASIWKLTKFTFTGAAILPLSKAAYEGSRFVLRKSEVPNE